MIKDLIFIAKEAGAKILEIYETQNYSIEYKEDESPLTLADKKAHEIIFDFLSEKYPNITVISEENFSGAERIEEKTFFIVDPLDGTKEFISKNGEFTVNIAYIENGELRAAVIYIPVWDEVYFAEKNKGAFLLKNDSEVKLPLQKNEEKVAVISRSHSGEVETEFLGKMGIKNIINVGSSIKLCWLASGKANIYVRKTPMMLWDIAAGYLICEEAGAVITEFDGSPVDLAKLKLQGMLGKNTIQL
jgi:3'(2'), 5'-bisphosphate nucleotidase